MGIFGLALIRRTVSALRLLVVLMTTNVPSGVVKNTMPATHDMAATTRRGSQVYLGAAVHVTTVIAGRLDAYRKIAERKAVTKSHARRTRMISI
jgi:hypothetical protein